MPDHDSTALLSRQTKRRRVDIGVKRTVGTASAFFAKARATFFSAMNPQGSEQDVEYSVVQHADGEKSNVLRKLLKRANSYEDAMMPFPGATIISQLLKNNMNKNGGTEPSFQASGLSSTGSEVHQEDVCSNSSRDSPQECLSPFGRPTMSQFDVDRLCDEHLRAKRARVENIIRGMSHSPSVALRGNENEREIAPQSVSPRESYRENKRKQKLPQQQQQSFQQLVSARKEQKREERRQLKQQLEDMQKQLRQLQEKFYQIYDSTDSENDEDGNLSEDSMRSETMDARAGDSVSRSDNEMCELDPGQFIDRARALIREQEIAENKPKREGPKEKEQGPNTFHPEGKHLAETLKQELNTAMSQVVDTVVKVFSSKPSRQLPQVFPPLQIPQARFAVNGENHNFHTANQRLQCFGDVIIPNPLDTFGSVPMPGATDQTEALPLVVRKNSSDQSASAPPAGGPQYMCGLVKPVRAFVGAQAESNRSEGSSLKKHFFERGTLPGRIEMQMNQMLCSATSVLLQLKLTRAGIYFVPSPSLPISQRFAFLHCCVSIEGGTLLALYAQKQLSQEKHFPLLIQSYMQEGLSPNHLKKAKLMFFYTRYPSSNMLKTYFSDVKFNRCITSQLIKWFSNFREFYYIQMEKYARQAINDGVTSTEELSITRDCELYRALNMHYNKANDFEVPERFLEVAQITLREFFNAIIAGKDVDPSWKKAIYKVICKLDSEVPEIFKSPNCLQELLHE
ncbi:Prospero homeobox protein 1 [Opisthocomus hoazin]|uniref:Prospero homeobox protein 1 n=1 Tax=Opisthocomus hoazin TaxID=30419 RepID=A0A091W222_OPIHO|nr:Prospero homeobox protein 1 [Opisthocomus hoazin]